MAYPVVPLEASTWDAFAELAERNDGIFGGCWCIAHHPECGQKGIDYRAAKQDRVLTDRAHAALVLDQAGLAQGWCQYGNDKQPPPLPGAGHRDGSCSARPSSCSSSTASLAAGRLASMPGS